MYTERNRSHSKPKFINDSDQVRNPLQARADLSAGDVSDQNPKIYTKYLKKKKSSMSIEMNDM